MDQTFDNKCEFFQHNKNRKCNIQIYKPGLRFCIHHLPQNDLQGSILELVDCPLDPNHQVKKAKLKKHLKVCNKIKLQTQMKENPFFQEKINQSINEIHENEPKRSKVLQQLCASNNSLFFEFIQAVPTFFDHAMQIYKTYLDEIGLQKNISDLKAYILDEVDINHPQEISNNEADLQQVNLLVDLLKQHNMLNSQNCYIEYGAGRGRLSHGVAEVLKEIEPNKHACHVLIERETRRQKFDRFHRDNPYFIRLRMDISDVNLDKLQQQLPKTYFEDKQNLHYVGICKHMCGMGSDLTINSLLRKSNQIFKGLVCATCCHHLCNQQSYVNMKFINSINVPNEMKDLLFSCSSWYVSGAIKVQNHTPNEFISTTERIRLGKMAKRIIDIGRILHIHKQSNLKGYLVKYCDFNLSPENFSIVFF